jgi:hypothetical protein
MLKCQVPQEIQDGSLSLLQTKTIKKGMWVASQCRWVCVCVCVYNPKSRNITAEKFPYKGTIHGTKRDFQKKMDAQKYMSLWIGGRCRNK